MVLRRTFGLLAHGTLPALLLASSAMAAGGPLPPGPFVPEPSIKGYGIRGVPGETLADMLSACHADRVKDTLALERCDQLLRSLHTQPGNSRGGH